MYVFHESRKRNAKYNRPELASPQQQAPHGKSCMSQSPQVCGIPRNFVQALITLIAGSGVSFVIGYNLLRLSLQ